jgi:transposase-like protein
VVRVRLDRKATSISLLVIIGVRQDGQKVLLAIKSMGGESAEAWRTVLDDLIKRGLRRPEFLIVDGAPGLEKAIAAVWDGVPVQRCTVHKHRNLLAHAPERLHEEISADYTDMIYAATPEEIEARRKAFIRKWRLRHRAVADSLEEAGDRLFTFTRLPPSQWRSVRTTNAIERLHEEFKRRIKTQTVLPSAETAAMLFWRCSRPVRSTCAKSMDGRRSPQSPLISQLTSPLDPIPSCYRRSRRANSNHIRYGIWAPARAGKVESTNGGDRQCLRRQKRNHSGCCARTSAALKQNSPQSWGYPPSGAIILRTASSSRRK